ncbi:formyltetrahydrofolate-dependent phosphoribosylglycinamide formyltransferase [Humidesulfovibrio mexicanus]|uniref:Phosphoribosylglycinamide formyltransferase n=1 Tax=Humidesulfovibrio mexicanus TaxID=147047 RepID=A0A238Z0Q3_9BACT|nr:phosphoribosylglycinamide formyltransferase [Humidesulfovibrio mexicanus]SNR76463.1 formyltetrahydrofolate-dependent phosphoribosylglycinamide formyltransferase [Humidesulfovibrio mexicanus]
MPMPLAVLVSGGGSNLQSILDKIDAGSLDAEVRLVVSNKPDAYGLERARARGIATWSRPHTDFGSREAFDAEMVRVIGEHGVRAGAGAVVLAGFMRMLTPGFLHAFPGAVVNIHPALLPSFPGTHGAADAEHYGVRLAGCSVHFVDEIMDHGPVIIQAAVPVLPGEGADALAARILTLEHCIYPQALAWLAAGRLHIDGRRVLVADAAPAACGDATLPYLASPALEPGFLPVH